MKKTTGNNPFSENTTGKRDECLLLCLLIFHQFIYPCLNLAVIISGRGELLLTLVAVAPLPPNNFLCDLVHGFEMRLRHKLVDLFLHSIIIITCRSQLPL